VTGEIAVEPCSPIRSRTFWASTMVVSGVTCVVKCGGALKTVIIARSFGARPELDCYLLAFLVPSFVAEVLCGAIVPLMVPRLIEFGQKGAAEEMPQLYRDAFWGSVALAGTLAVVIAAIARGMVAINGHTEQIALTTQLMWIMLPMLPLSAAANMWRAALNAREQFAVAAGVSIATPLSIAASLSVFGPNVHWLAAGTLAGAFGEFAILGLSARKFAVPVSLPRHFNREAYRGAARDYVALAVNNFVAGGSLFLDQSMATLAGPGAVSILNYGTRLIYVLGAIGPDALGVTALPRMSKLIVQQGRRGLLAFVWRFLIVAMLASAAITMLLLCLSSSIVKLAFERGAFGAADTFSVASVQRYSLLQLPFTVGIAFLTRVIASAKMNQILIPISVTALVLNAILNVVLMRWYSVAGIALATTISQGVVLLSLIFSVRSSIKGEETEPC